MYLENLVFDAAEPQLLGRFWEAAIGAETLTDEPDGFETRLTVAGGPVLDLCFQRVADLRVDTPRLGLALSGGEHQGDEADRLLALGARRLDVGEDDVPWAALADPEGTPFSVLHEDAAYAGTGPLALLSLDSADPNRDAVFWSWLTGWTVATGDAPRSLRHPSRRGPVLELRAEAAAKGTAKNRRHLDLRLEAGDDADAVAAGITARAGVELHPQWGDLPWRVFTDPSGNEFCVLPARS